MFSSRLEAFSMQKYQASPPAADAKSVQRRPLLKSIHSLTWACLLLTCIGASWFAFQVFLVPQPQEFTPDWQNARWIQAVDTSSSTVAYFRYGVHFDAPPDQAFVTVAANQVFRLYINGIYIGSNTMDFVQGNAPQTYMYDVDATMLTGMNVIGLRVANADRGTPQVRATVGAIWGQQIHYYSTDATWQSTGDTSLAHPRAALSDYFWSQPTFDASRWQSANIVGQEPKSSSLRINPQIYKSPLPLYWISGGVNQESYFVRNFTIPTISTIPALSAGSDNALLRIVATGEADIFINDHLYTRWNGLVNVPQLNAVTYLTDNGQPAPYRNGLMLGVYDISPYLHTGTNTIAIHVLAPGTTTAKVGLDTQKSALSVDMLVGSGSSYSNPLASDADWHVAAHPVDGWQHASNATLTWNTPDLIGRPGASHTFYLPDSNTPRNVQVIPPVQIAETSAGWSATIVAFWLLLALLVIRRYYRSTRASLEAASLVFLPALACEAILLACARESQLPQPFPYTPFWGLALISVVGLSAVGLWLQARKTAHMSVRTAASTRPSASEHNGHISHNGQVSQSRRGLHNGRDKSDPYLQAIPPGHTVNRRTASACLFGNVTALALDWLRHNWAVVPVILIAIPMVLYNPTYEPYWQDELSSYNAALWIMAHGYPAFPSGFIYMKGELFSYLLALLMSIFGTTSQLVPRTISMACFLLSLPILYIVGSKLFNRKVGWLATAMLAFSPYAMIWSRQTRMYELAQFMVILVLFTFYRAVQERDRVRPLLLASVCLLLAYFSHEEVFIILPGLVLCVLFGSREGPRGFPAVLRKPHWWLATLFGATIICLQLATVFMTHPPKFATDQSLRPQIQLTLNNIPYYYHLLFAPIAPKDGPTVWVPMTPFIVINSLLAVLGCILAFCRKDKRAQYCALFLICATLTLTFVFTMQADRYYYPLLPVFYLMAAYACWKILLALWLFARPYLLQIHENTGRTTLSRPVRVGIATTVACFCASILLVPMLPLSNFNLFLSRITGSSYHEHFADYDDVGRYMQTHMQNGDTVISIAPAVITLYYVGHVDDFFSIDRALFLFENNGQIVETTSGAHPLLTQNDFQAVLSTHNRIWIISDAGGYQGGVTRNGRFTFPPPDFRMVYEGYGSSIYFRSDGG